MSNNTENNSIFALQYASPRQEAGFWIEAFQIQEGCIGARVTDQGMGYAYFEAPEIASVEDVTRLNELGGYGEDFRYVLIPRSQAKALGLFAYQGDRVA